MRIGDKEIGSGHAPYLVAEMSGEHLGSIERACDLISAAHAAGADAVKLQCFDPDRLAELRGGKNKVIADGLWRGWSLGSLYRETHTPRRWFPVLMSFARTKGITLFTSVFDPDDVEFAVSVGCPALKIAAAESKDHRLMMAAKATKLPVIASVNTGDLGIWGYADAVLHCPRGYPCPIQQTQLRRIKSIPHTVVGLSDHTLGTVAAVAAVSHGACIIEKHITLERSTGGLDATYSLEPDEFRQMARDVMAAWEAQ